MFTQGCLPQIGTIWVEAFPNFHDLSISLSIQLGSLWNFKLKLLGYQPIIPTTGGLPQNGYYKTWGSPNYWELPLYLPNQFGSLWNFKLKLLGYQLTKWVAPRESPENWSAQWALLGLSRGHRCCYWVLSTCCICFHICWKGQNRLTTFF